LYSGFAEILGFKDSMISFISYKGEYLSKAVASSTHPKTPLKVARPPVIISDPERKKKQKANI
jgi:hypothetical protein